MHSQSHHSIGPISPNILPQITVPSFDKLNFVDPGSFKGIGVSMSFKNITLASTPKKTTQSSPSAFDLRKNYQMIQIRILSTWGSASYATISSLALLDSEKHKLPVVDCLLSFSTRLSGEFSKVFNEYLDKTDPNDLFTFSWPPTSNYALISLFYPTDCQLSGIRLWNSSTDPDSGIREFEVYRGEEFVLKDEVPRGFGVNKYVTKKLKGIPSSSSAAILRDLFPEKFADPPLIDRYGHYPLEDTKAIVLVIYSAFYSELRFGLNGVEIYDQKNRLVTLNDILDLKIKNVTHMERINALFRIDKDSNSMFDMFLADARSWDSPPEIEIIFKRPLRITKVCIHNYNANNPSTKAGVSRLGIKNEKRFIWKGKIQISSGLVPPRHSDRKFISFIDLPNFYCGTSHYLYQDYLQKEEDFEDPVPSSMLVQTELGSMESV